MAEVFQHALWKSNSSFCREAMHLTRGVVSRIIVWADVHYQSPLTTSGLMGDQPVTGIQEQ